MPKRGSLKSAGNRQESATFPQRRFFNVAVQFFVCCSAAFGQNDVGTAEKRMLQCKFCSAAFRKLQRKFRFSLSPKAGHNKAGRSDFEISDSNPIRGKRGKCGRPLSPYKNKNLKTPHRAKTRKTRKMRTRKRGTFRNPQWDLGAQGGNANVSCMKQCAWRKHGLCNTRLAEACPPKF